MMGNCGLGKRDILCNSTRIDFFVALNDIQNHLSFAVMNSSEKPLPFFGT